MEAKPMTNREWRRKYRPQDGRTPLSFIREEVADFILMRAGELSGPFVNCGWSRCCRGSKYKARLHARLFKLSVQMGSLARWVRGHPVMPC